MLNDILQVWHLLKGRGTQQTNIYMDVCMCIYIYIYIHVLSNTQESSWQRDRPHPGRCGAPLCLFTSAPLRQPWEYTLDFHDLNIIVHASSFRLHVMHQMPNPLVYATRSVFVGLGSIWYDITWYTMLYHKMIWYDIITYIIIPEVGSATSRGGMTRTRRSATRTHNNNCYYLYDCLYIYIYVYAFHLTKLCSLSLFSSSESSDGIYYVCDLPAIRLPSLPSCWNAFS